MRHQGLLLAGFAALTAAALPPAFAEPSVRTPQEIWDLTCHACHDTGVAPQILGEHLPVDQIKSTVRNGGMQMSGISEGQISDDELEALAAWVNAHDAPEDE